MEKYEVAKLCFLNALQDNSSTNGSARAEEYKVGLSMITKEKEEDISYSIAHMKRKGMMDGTPV